MIGEQAKVGNFVEVKNTRVGKAAKANHLAYLGDADIGSQSNVGAGTITCNYDGANKHRTTLGEGVFVGSNSTLVAPLVIESGGFVAAGSTVTDDVKADQLAVAEVVSVMSTAGNGLINPGSPTDVWHRGRRGAAGLH